MADVTQSYTAENMDPRILRSRQMLMEALLRLLSRKEFDDISIQEIADEANLNRATFYLHYPDKNALLQAMTAARFRDLTARRGLSFTNCDSALREIALGVCDYLAETTGCPSQLAKMPLEGSIIPVIEDIFREGARHHAAKPGSDTNLLATTAAWAIYGAARQWYETPNRIPAEEMAAKIEMIVKPIFLSASA
ncbi:MAG TPA: TetR/AcrR family transcriptional regulator [Alloacidobacterium sp.]|nr:TetR/AcrR family transcriptional regulator [Alloacidobacterium sp.]